MDKDEQTAAIRHLVWQHMKSNRRIFFFAALVIGLFAAATPMGGATKADEILGKIGLALVGLACLYVGWGIVMGFVYRVKFSLARDETAYRRVIGDETFNGKTGIDVSHELPDQNNRRNVFVELYIAPIIAGTIATALGSLLIYLLTGK